MQIGTQTKFTCRKILFLVGVLSSCSLFFGCLFFFSNGEIRAQEAPGPVQEAPPVQAQPVHPPEWITQHGKEFTANKDLCKACHAEDLSGGFTGFKCDLCHLPPQHPPDWKEVHGPKFLENRSQCTLCHGAQPFSGDKKPWTMNCTRCHSVNSDISRWQAESQTSQIYVNTTNNFQIREDRFDNREFATNHYVGFHLSERSKQIITSTQFRLSREWLDPQTNIDLYEATVEFDNLLKNLLTITLGRQGFGSNIDYFLMDGANFHFKPVRWSDLSVYVGVPRYIEQNDLDGEVGLVAGLGWILKPVDYTKARIDFVYQKKNFSDNDLNGTDKMFVAASFSQGVSILNIYGRGEYDVTDTLPIALTVGTEIFPFVKKVGFLVEGSYFNESRNDDLDTVFSVFSAGALWQGRTGVSINLVKNLALTSNFSFQRYEILDGLHRNGYNADAGVRYYFEKAGLDTAFSYYFYRSYGGTLHGVNMNLYKEWSRRFFSNLFADYLTYTKVTNNDDIGLNAVLSSGVRIIPGFVLSAAFEYARNDVLKNDLRGTFNLNYTFNDKFLEFEKRGANAAAK